MSSPHSERAHSQVGASSAYRWMNCSGSVKHLELHPMPTSDAAAEGTKAHELSELMLLDKVVEYAQYDTDMIGFIREYVEWIHTVMGSIESVHGQWPEMIVEQRFNMKSVSDKAFGTNDVALSVDFGPLHIIDLKYGHRYVDVVSNDQLMYYALGIIEELGLNPTEVHLWIYGPRMGQENPAMHWKCSMEDLLAFHKELIAGAKRVDTHPDVFTPGESQCYYCNRAECPAVQEKVTKEFNDIEPIQDLPNALAAMNTADLVERYKYKELFEGLFRDTAIILKSRAEHGENIPGFKLVRSFGHRAFNADVSTKQLKGLGLSLEDIHKEPDRKSPAQIESILKKKYPSKKKEDKPKRKSVMKQFDQMVNKPDRGLSLVSDARSGEAVAPKMEFSDVPQLEGKVEPDLSEFD